VKIAYLGLGNMGAAIARHLLVAGHQVTVFNRTREKTKALADAGADVASTPAEAARGADVAFSMLADDAATEQIVFAEDGLAAGLAPEATHVSNSTISLALARRLSDEHQARGQFYVSAPVFGRPEAAAAKRLLVVAAGPEVAFQRVKPLLDAIGRGTIVIGSEAWQANAVKLCGNFMIMSLIEAFAEAFASLRKAGVDHRLFLDVTNELFASPVYKLYGGILADRRYLPASFFLRLGLKDVNLVLDAAREAGTEMPVAELFRDNMIAAMEQGMSELDWSAVAEIAAQRAGLS
jgi:3-hydroxyisobutyrate dehydrogenase-like beta-hydroxyacid dehydrogenase